MSAASVTQFAHQTKGDEPMAEQACLRARIGRSAFHGGHRAAHVLLRRHRRPERPAAGSRNPALTLLNGYTARLVNQNELNLREAWLRTELFSQKLALSAGRLDLTNYFDHNAAANDETIQFISDALVNNPTLGWRSTAPDSSAFSIRRTVSPSRSASSRATPTRRTCPNRSSRWRKSDTSRGRRDCRKGTIASGTAPTTAASGTEPAVASASIRSSRPRFDAVRPLRPAQSGRSSETISTAGLPVQNGAGFQSGGLLGRRLLADRPRRPATKEKLVEGYYNFQISENCGCRSILHTCLRSRPATQASVISCRAIRLQASF